jgi:hypothetical protein
MSVLATCEPANPSWQAGAVIVLIAVLLYVLPVCGAFVTAPSGTRRWLAGVYLLAIGISVLFGYVVPGGVSSAGANYLTLFFIGLVSGTVVGMLAAAARPAAGIWRYLVLGTWGGGTYLAGAIGLLFFALAATHACLD